MTDEEFERDLKLALYTDDDEAYTIKIDEIKNNLVAKRDNLPDDIKSEISNVVIDELIFKNSKKITRHGILSEKRRLSGREMDEIRKITIEAGVLL